MFDAIKSRISSIWKEDESWSDRMVGRDYAATRDFVVLTDMIVKVAQKGEFTRAVEIGCGDGKYSEFIKDKVPSIETWIATDIDGPRIIRAKKEIQRVRIEVASILDVIARYNEPGTLFFCANVFGNIAPDEIKQFYSGLKVGGTGLAFLAGGLPVERDDDYVVRPNGIAFDHNFFALTRSARLSQLDYRVETYGDIAGTILYWMTGIVPKQPVQLLYPEP